MDDQLQMILKHPRLGGLLAHWDQLPASRRRNGAVSGQADGSTFPAAALALVPPANPPVIFRVAEKGEPG